MADYIKMRDALLLHREQLDEAILAVAHCEVNRFDVHKALKEFRERHTAVVEAIAVLERLERSRRVEFDAAGKKIARRGGWKWSKEAREAASKRAKKHNAEVKPQPAVS